MSGATPIAAGRDIPRLRLMSIIVFSLMLTSGVMVAIVGCGSDSFPGGELSGTIAATTIDSFTVSPSTVYVGEEVTFTASASSTTGSQLIFTFFYDAVVPPYPTNNTQSPYSEHITGNPGTVTTTFTYDRLGNLTSAPGSYYVVRLFVNDGAETRNMTRPVYVIENTAPTFVLTLPSTMSLLPDQVVDLSIIVADADNDPVTVTWDFGDGTIAVNSTGNALTGVPVSQTHAWSPDIGPGMGPVLYYSLVVTLEDPYSNTRTTTTSVGIQLPYNGLPVIYLRTSVNLVDPEEEMTFYANATDPEGEALTWTWVMNNSIEDIEVLISHTDATPPGTKVWNNVTYAFSNPGTYNIRLYVSDALIPYQISPHNVTRSVKVIVVGNSAPSVNEIAMSDESPSIDTELGYEIVTFTIRAYDGDGDALTVTWDLDDDDPVTNTSTGGLDTYTFRQDRTFTASGTYNISLEVTDGIVGHEVLRYRIVNVTSNNLPPNVIELNFTYETGDFAIPGESIDITLTLSDPEMDVLEVIWDFGDNTSRLYFNLTEYVNGVTTCTLNHTYTEVGVYNITIWYTDNQMGLLTHDKVKYVKVTVDDLYIRVVGGWGWWDYTSLAFLIFIPVALILNVYRLHIQRKRIEEKGVTLEEMNLRESESAEELEEDFYAEVD